MICYVLGVLRAKLGRPGLSCLFALTAGLCAASPGCGGTNMPPFPNQPQDAGVQECAPGEFSTSDGCVATGIQGCAGGFLGEDGPCRPALAACSPGAVPKHDEGCVSAGLPSCAEEFVEGGACRPTMAKCEEGTFAVPQKGCLSIDGPDGCGAAPWGHVVEMPGDIHVDPGHAGGAGDGSRGAPFTTIEAALQAVEAGGRVVLAEGDYSEPVEITKPIELVGRCASKVRLLGEQPDDMGNFSAIWIHDVERAGVSGVSVARESSVAGESIGLMIRSAQVLVRDVRVTGASGIGVSIEGEGAFLDISRSLLQSTRAGEDTGEIWKNVLVSSGARAQLVENALVGGSVDLRLTLAAGEVVAEGNLLEAAASQAGAGDSVGVLMDAGTLRLDGNALVHHGVGALVTGSGVELAAARDLIIGPPEGAPAAGHVTVQQGARATLRSSVLSGASDAQLLIEDAGAVVEVSGSLFEGAGAADDRLGYAIEQRGGTLTLSSSAVSEAGDAALLVSGGTLSAEGLVIEGTRARPLDGDRAAGVLVQGARAALVSTYVRGARVAGVAVSQGAELELTDSLIEGTGTEEAGGTGGVGLLSSGAESVIVRRSAVLGSRVAGLLLRSSPATVEDTLIQGVESGTFSAPSESVQDMGDGLLVLRATAQVSRVHVEGCARAGLLFGESDGALARSRSTGNRFGLVLQGAPVPKVAQDNSFEGNEERDRLNAGNLPVPGRAVAAP